MRTPRVLVVGWSSVLRGEATAGDVLSMAAASSALRAAGATVDVAWSRVMRPAAPPTHDVALEDVDPGDYTHVVWACGPLTGAAVADVLTRFPAATTIAVGVSVIDPTDPVVAAFDAVIARDAPGQVASVDLAAAPASGPGMGAVPVLGVYLAPGQVEYGTRRRHEAVAGVLGEWLASLDAATLDLDTRLDPRAWRSPRTPEQVTSVMGRCDAVVSSRLHGLVLALARGVPVLAVDPVAGGGEVGEQARAWHWPALVGAEDVSAAVLGRQLAWCLSPPGRAAARAASVAAPGTGARQLARLVELVLG